MVPDELFTITSTLVVDGPDPSPRQIAAVFGLVDDSLLQAWLVDHGVPLLKPGSRPRLVARNALLLEPEFGRIIYTHIGSPILVQQIVRGGRRAVAVVAVVSATLGTTLLGVNEALDQLSGTIDRVERIYDQVRDFGEDDRKQRELQGILRGRGTEPRIEPDHTRIERLPSRDRQ
jgi:hypothetical protein